MGGFREIDDHNFDHDPMTGVRQRLKIDSDGVMHFVSEQDDTDLRRYTHECRSSFSKNQRLGDMAPVGSIPMLVMWDLIKSGIWQDPERRRKWWNSDLAAPYRTRDFRV